jgi:hypothetical protein
VSSVAPTSHQASNTHLRNKSGERGGGAGTESVRAIIQEGGSLIQGIRSKLANLEQSKMQLQSKIEQFETKMQRLENKRQ